MASSIIIEAEGKVGTLDAVAVSDDCLNVIFPVTDTAGPIHAT